MKTMVDFRGLKLELASSDVIRSWSHGEVTKPETINYRTLKPEKDGLFCERIFGPTRDYECYCGKYKRIRFRGIVCDKCGVEVTQSRVRRERMAHINLASPVVHVWYFKGAPSQLSLLLNISPKSLTRVIYFAQYVVLDVDKKAEEQVLKDLKEGLNKKHKELDEKAEKEIDEVKAAGDKEIAAEIKNSNAGKEQLELKTRETQFRVKQEIARVRELLVKEKDTAGEVFKAVLNLASRLERRSLLTEDEYLKLLEYSATDHLRLGMGAEAVEELLLDLNLEAIRDQLRQELITATGATKTKKSKRLRLIDGLIEAKIDPRWTLIKVLPVLPPDLRPMVQLSGGRFATSDLNDLYRRVINRNNRLKHLIDLGAPEIILRNEKRMLQEAVDSLIDSPQSRTTRRQTLRRELKSLSEMLRGKQGRFRQNLLGKRVDYSGRSVIVVGPELKLNQCGLPKDMALEMFKPFVLRELISQGISPNVRSAKAALERRSPEVYDILEKITKNHPVLLNRAPTLHKLGIQAFYPILIEGSAIRIHPCVCSGYNADFDGDQMAVHVPLSVHAQEEAASIMMPERNLLKPSSGTPITVPNKEMAMGCYYLTSFDPDLKLSDTIFSGKEEVITALQNNIIEYRQPIMARIEGKIIETTAGRIIFNRALPDNVPFMNRPITAGAIQDLVREAIGKFSIEDTVNIIDSIKEVGFNAATISGLSVSVSDCVIIPGKDAIIGEANQRAVLIEQNFDTGLITNEERRRLTNQLWMETTDDIAEKTWNALGENNAVKIIIDSGGTRASRDQVKQLSAMRGLVVDPLGNIVELPTKSNFRQGLSVFEYVTSTRGSRKGLTDSALKTADAGYLTRRLVDVTHDVIVRSDDCGTEDGLTISKTSRRGDQFIKRTIGRILAEDVLDGKKVIAKRGDLIDEQVQKLLLSPGVESIVVRSPLTCVLPYGICKMCYGWDFGQRKLAELGFPAGVVAAQSIGEPGTQLTMRIKHTGGIVGLDVTQGLPRVEELFEARSPKMLAPIAGIAGKVDIKEIDRGIMIKISGKDGVEEKHLVSATAQLQVQNGQQVPAGWQMASGALDVDQLVEVKGVRASQEYLIHEIQTVYESQGIPINDKHFEVIVRKMSDKARITDPGSTAFLHGELVDSVTLNTTNAQTMSSGGKPAAVTQVILGITRASLYTHSWLSAASFIETTKVLTEAALEGKEDPLLGLKENVIIGRLIPTSEDRAAIPAS